MSIQHRRFIGWQYIESSLHCHSQQFARSKPNAFKSWSIENITLGLEKYDSCQEVNTFSGALDVELMQNTLRQQIGDRLDRNDTVSLCRL